MGLGEVLLLRRLGLGILSFTGALVVLLGGWILISAFTSAPEIALRTEKTLAKKVRAPSSELSFESPALSHVVKVDAKVETVALGCLRNGAHIEIRSGAKQVRLRGRLCAGLKTDLGGSSIVNRSNGFSATLFNLEDGNFSSDYIALVEGSNSLWLEIDGGNGARAVTEVTILRSSGLHSSEP